MTGTTGHRSGTLTSQKNIWFPIFQASLGTWPLPKKTWIWSWIILDKYSKKPMIVNHRWTSWSFYISKLPKWGKVHLKPTSQSTLCQQKTGGFPEPSSSTSSPEMGCMAVMTLTWHERCRKEMKMFTFELIEIDRNWTFELIADLYGDISDVWARTCWTIFFAGTPCFAAMFAWRIVAA